MVKKYLFLLVIPLLGLIVLAYVTSIYGVGLTPDSVNYLSAAKNFSLGKGLFTNVIRWNCGFYAIPLIHWPPLFSILIASLYSAGLGLDTAAWLINLIVFGFNSFLVGYFLLKATDSKTLAGFGSFLFLIPYPAYIIHSQALSEPLFITFMLTSFICCTRFLKGGGLMVLFLTGLFTGLGWVTRYVGFTVALTIGLCLLILSEKNWFQRLLAAAFFGLTAIIPIAIWGYRNYKLVNVPFDRWIPPDVGFFDNVKLFVTTISSWFFPFLPAVLALTLFGGMLLAISLPFFFNAENKISLNFHLKISLLYLTIYSVTLIVLSSFFSNIPIRTRLLTPLLPFLLIAILTAVYTQKEWWLKKIPSKYLIVVVGILLLPMLVKAAEWGVVTTQEGSGYNSKLWRENECVQWLNKQKLERVLFSQANDALVFLTDYRVRDLLLRSNADQMERFIMTVSRYNGLIVYLDYVNRPQFFSEEELMATGKFVPVFSFKGGRIYELKME